MKKLLTVMLSLYAGLTSCSGDLGPGGAVGRRSSALAGLSPTTQHDDDKNGMLRAGRMSAVAIDPTDAKHAVALADGGGVYVSHDGGASWESAVNPDGTTGLYGHGFEGMGIGHFLDVAISPDGQTMLLLAGPGRKSAVWPGVWRSTDGGKSWSQPTNPSPSDAPSDDEIGARSRIVFSPTPQMVYAVAGKRLGISENDGASFTWSDPYSVLGVPAHMPLEGLDVFPAGDKKNPFGENAASGGSDALALCVIAEIGAQTYRLVLFYNVRNQETIVQLAPPLGLVEGGHCMVAFDPNNSLHVFVTSQGKPSDKQSNIAQGIMDPVGQAITWTDLEGKSSTNRRTVFVQTRRKSDDTVAVYYHNSTDLYTKDCPSKGACPPGEWTKLAMNHVDATRLAFDPDGHCPLLATNDGGIERSSDSDSDCGAKWNADVSGIHGLEMHAASFAGYGIERSVFLALQDNGIYFSRLTDAQLQNPPPGLGVSELPWYEKPSGDGLGAQQLRTDPTTATTRSNSPNVRLYRDLRSNLPDMSALPLPPASAGVPLSITDDETPIGVFVGPGVYAMPVLDPDDRLQMLHLDVATGDFTLVGNPSPKMSDPSIKDKLSDPPTHDCDIAAAGETGLGGANIFVIQGKLLWLFNGVGWTAVGGPEEPLRVWGDSLDRNRAYVLDSNSRMWRTAGGAAILAKDDGLSLLVTDNGDFKKVPGAGCTNHVCSVAFDPQDPQRIAVGTSHAGILLSVDGGGSWSKSGNPPEPNGGIKGLYFDPAAGPNGENALASIWGQGLWAVRIAAAAIVFPQPGDDNVVSGTMKDVNGDAMDAARLRVRIVDTQILDRLGAAAAAAEAQRDSTLELEGLDPEDTGSEPAPPFFSTVTVEQTRVGPPRPAPPGPAPQPEPSEVVADFIAPTPTNPRGEFSIALPQLQPGSYYVQVIFEGDARTPPTTAGAPYDGRHLGPR